MSRTWAQLICQSCRRPHLTNRSQVRLNRFWLALLLWLSSAAVSCVAATANTTGDYRLGPGDLLHITVSGYPEIATDVRVSQTGNITYPFIAEGAVANLSTQEL